jgi:hypothetical protein
MITGFNTNIRHDGRLFHVQTEDSGRNNPHVISHIYHGGTILASEKQEYHDLLESEDLEPEVRNLMEGQHKAMLDGLRKGEFDAVIKLRLGAPAGIALEDSAGDGKAAAAASAGPADGSSDGLERGSRDETTPEKPLDEVILDYLVDKSRGRAPGPARRPPRRGSGSDE